MSVLDLNFNPISVLTDNFNQMDRLTEMRIQDHSLNHLPKSIQLLNPNIFRFGKNGIPCNCDNLWISEWRIYKNASDNWKLYCSNYVNKTFEDIFNLLKDCGDENIVIHYLIIYALIGVVVLILLPFMLSHFRYELMILHRKIKDVRYNARIKWKYDTYISFDDQNECVREFVFLELIPFLERAHNYRIYVPCRDSIPGNQVEHNLISNMKISKTVLIIHSKSMYGLEKSKSASIVNKDDNLQDIERQARRVEYSYAWTYFTSGYLRDIAIIDFDNANQNNFNRSKTIALQRLGMTIDIYNRNINIKSYILKFLDRPIGLPKASVGKLKNCNDKPTDKVDTSESVFDLKNTNLSDKSNPNKRPRTCISESSDHSVCIERELEDIRKSMDKIVKKDDFEEIVTNIIGKLLNKWKTEIKKEILEEVNKESVKMKVDYDRKFEMIGRNMDYIDFDNANLLEKMQLCKKNSER
ncbi:unnamed protein product [Mytilus coruscus]|uniref:TIR domain-containing protein n=1 Tax=Mytilus coruscus TaxID=42192 RepID=A0A6J8ACR6_MYTCO|nr:unnamed protein product [Mytilus coruscus]